MDYEKQDLKAQVDRLQGELDTLKDLFYRTNQIDRTSFNTDVYLNNRVFFGKDGKVGFYGKEPIVQGATIADPTGQANDLDSEARTAINSIIDTLEEIGLIA